METDLSGVGSSSRVRQPSRGQLQAPRHLSTLHSRPNAEEDDVIQALVALGSTQKEAVATCQRASKRLQGLNEPPSAEKLLKEALRRER